MSLGADQSNLFSVALLQAKVVGLVATKPVFGVSDKVRFKPVSSAIETSLQIEISLVASLDMIHVLSKKRITKALISMHRCAGWSASLLFATP